mmetsp:Transcript_19142/g.25930  ORF Transcript_19142/g.25930 Transcript_19142/m.25930 type:complete len:91 (+) Transcript_19142:125-397(+)
MYKLAVLNYAAKRLLKDPRRRSLPENYISEDSALLQIELSLQKGTDCTRLPSVSSKTVEDSRQHAVAESLLQILPEKTLFSPAFTNKVKK